MNQKHQTYNFNQKLFWHFAILFLLLKTGVIFSQSAYTMSSGNKTWDLAGAWTVSGATYTGTDAGNWASVGIIGSGTSVTTGLRTTKSSSAIVSGTSGGFQKPSGTIQFLSTGSGATSEAVAIDLLLDFTNRVAGTLSLDWAAIDNGGTRPTSLRIFWSTNGTTFTELTAAQSLERESATSPAMGSISNITLPSAFSGSSTARLRFYNHAGSTLVGSGSRDKFQIDNISVTSTVAAIITSTGTPSSMTSTYGSSTSAPTSFDVSGTGLSAGISINPPAGFDVSTTNDFSSNVGTNASPIIVGFSGTIAPITIYIRLSNGLSAGNFNGNVVLSSTGATPVNVALNSVNTVNLKELTISGLTANNKSFDNNTTATLTGTPLLVGIVSGEESNVSLGGTPVANFDTALVGTSKPVTVSGFAISGTASVNYSLTQPIGLVADIISSGLLDQSITFTALSNVTYGDSTFNLTAISDSSLAIDYMSSNTTVATVLGNVVTIVGSGSTTITASQSGNSSYNPAISVNQNLVVEQKNLTIIGAIANDKIYDGTTNAIISGGSLVGIVGADIVSFSGNGNFDTANVGNLKVVTGALVLNGAQWANYLLSQPILSADITEKEVTITGISIANKEYDTNNSAVISGTPSLNGVEGIDGANVLLAGTPLALFNDASVANGKAVSVSGYSISGSAMGNYSLTQPSGFTANITPKTISIIGLTAASKEYDRTTSATLSGTALLSGLISGDETNISLDGSPLASFTTSSAGINKSVIVSGYSLSGTSLVNYTLSPLTLIATISKKDVTISGAAAIDKVYDATSIATITGTLSGVIAPDDVTLNLSATFADANVGTNKVVTSFSSISGVDFENYNLVQPIGLTASINAGLCEPSSGLATWTFGTSGSSVAPYSSSTITGVAISNLTQGNNIGNTTIVSTTSASSSYTGFSAGGNAGAATVAAPLNTSTSTYFEFTLTPQAGYDVALNAISFGSRSTNTGPAAYTLRSNKDGFTSNVCSGVLTVTGNNWVLYTPTVTSTSTENSTPIIFRLYGHNGTGSPSSGTANWRIDDLKLNLTASPSAALSGITTATICSGDTFSYSPTTSHTGSTISWTRAAVAGISNLAVNTPQSINPNEILVNTTSLPINVIYTYKVTSSICYVSQEVTVMVKPLFNWYLDADNDGYSVGSILTQCDSPGANYRNSGFLGSNDCNDNQLQYADLDADGFGSTTLVACGITDNSDCNDNEVRYLDADNDGYGAIAMVKVACGGSLLSTDCNDLVNSINPGAIDVCYDGIDNDCNGIIDNVGQPGGCTPIVSTLSSASCGAIVTGLNATISATFATGAQGFRFRVTRVDMNTNAPISAPIIVDRSVANFSLSSVLAVSYNSKYQVEVSVKYNNVYQPYYGASCYVTTGSPVATVGLQCGSTLTSLNQWINATIVPQVGAYKFRVTQLDNLGNAVGASQEFVSGMARFNMNQFVGVLYSTPYSIEVSLRNTDLTYLPYNAPCTVTTPAYPTAQVRDAQCNSYVVANNTAFIYADLVSGATAYRFRVYLLDSSSAIIYDYSHDSSFNRFTLNNFPGLVAGTTYTVQVAAKMSGQVAFGPYNKQCTIITPGASKLITSKTIEVANVFEASAYPNPFTSNFQMEVKTDNQAEIVIRVYDMLGKLVEQKTVAATEIQRVEVGTNYPSGVYNVIVSQGEFTKTLRVIKR